MIVRTAALYLAVFAGVLAALSFGAYAFMAREYASLVGPALGTPEAAAGVAIAMHRVLLTILAVDAPLIVVVALASYALARAAIAPIDAARERERQFAGDAAHELRTPLTEIATVAQAARADAPPQSRAAFEEIARTALDASEIVSSLLTLARDPRPGVLQREPVDLAAVASSARDLETKAASRGVKLEVSVQSAIVDGDERRLRELSRNLVENAIRHAFKRVRVTTSSSRNGGCDLVVEDDGTGIPPDDRERVFERFYRRERDNNGTGLGLAIVRWIALAHEGNVSISESTLGGAQVTATFPAHRES